MDEDQNQEKGDCFMNYLKSRNVNYYIPWKEKLLDLSNQFSKIFLKTRLSQKKSISWSNYCDNFRIFQSELGLVQDSLFFPGCVIESGIVNCMIGKVVFNPHVIIVSHCMPDEDDIDQDMCNQIIEILSSLNITIILCTDKIPPSLVAKFIFKGLTAIQQVPLEVVKLLQSLSGIPILESFASIYVSLPCIFNGLFYVSDHGFEFQEEEIKGKELTIKPEIAIMMKNGFKKNKNTPTAFFVHNETFSQGTFLLYGCKSEVNENTEIQDALETLLNVEFNDYCIEQFRNIVKTPKYVEDPFNIDFPFSLIHFSSPDFSVCSPFVNSSYSSTDLSLKNFISQAIQNTVIESEPFFQSSIVDSSVFDLEKQIAFRLLHGNVSLTFSSFQRQLIKHPNQKKYKKLKNKKTQQKVIKRTGFKYFGKSKTDDSYSYTYDEEEEDNEYDDSNTEETNKENEYYNALYFKKDYQYVKLENDQLFEMSFTAFSRYLMHANISEPFLIIYDGIGLLVEKNSDIVCKIADPITPPDDDSCDEIDNSGPIANYKNPDEEKSIRFFTNIIHAAEIILAQSLSKCPNDKAGPLFLKMKDFITQFGKKVIEHSDWESSLRSQFFVALFRWYVVFENMSPSLKSLKIPDVLIPYSTSACRHIIIKLLLFIEFRDFDYILEKLENFSEDNAVEGVESQWLYDHINAKKSPAPTTEQYLTSITMLFFAAACNYFYPKIVILYSVNLNQMEPATIIAFAFASDRFVAHTLNHCPKDLMNTLFEGKMTTEGFAKILSAPEYSSTFTLELEEDYPVSWPNPAPKVSVEILFPLEFLSLISLYGYTLRSVVHILKTGHATMTAGGKSAAKYFETSDHRFLIKTISPVEMNSMPSFLPHYFKYMCANTNNKFTRFLGCFSIDVQGVYHYKCILMENLRFGFVGKDIILYDFKGASRNRFIDDNEMSVQLDTNYEQSSLDNRVIFDFEEKQKFMRQINQDAHFLASHNIMDYSLVCVLCRSELVVRIGIVDIFRPYTLDKALETWVKKTRIYSEHNIDPTIISPDNYCERFVKALDKYFYQSPNDKDANAMRKLINQEKKDNI